MRVQKQRQQEEYPPPVAAHSAARVLRDNEDRSRCFVDLYRECIERAMPHGGRRREKSANTRTTRAAIGVGTKTSRWWSKDHLGLVPPGGFRMAWLGEFGYCEDRTKCTVMSARYHSIVDLLVHSLLNTYLKYIAYGAREILYRYLYATKKTRR